ncbi:MAG TPA: TIGR04563 family protein [Vulgatibacter sp.]|nr:TIGR04563 family protein [Vulgatibacter sp.]
MAGTDKRKQSLYFPEEMLQEIQMEANRQDRSLSWIVQQAWRIARNEITRFPSVNDVIGGEVALPDRREEQNL